MDMTKIDALNVTPRQITKELTAIRSKPFFFFFGGVKKWEHDMANSEVVFSCVVQADECLFDPKESSWASGVVLYTTDKKRCRDIEWLQNLSDTIIKLKTSGTGDREVDLIGAHLAAEDSSFDMIVPPQITGGAEVHIMTTYLSPDKLPNQYIPSHRILPGLVIDGEFSIMPPSLYL